MRTDGYHASRQRIAGFVRETHGDLLVPSCPAWNVHDLVAHLSGITEALIGGDSPPADAQAWIDRLVAERRDVAIPEMLDRWQACAEGIARLPSGQVSGMLADIVVHEHDLRGALGRPGARDSSEVQEVVSVFLHIHASSIDDVGLGPLAIARGDDHLASHPGNPACTLHVDDWEATRVLASRRTADEMRALPSTGNIEPYIDILDAHAPLPAHSLGEFQAL